MILVSGLAGPAGLDSREFVVFTFPKNRKGTYVAGNRLVGILRTFLDVVLLLTTIGWHRLNSQPLLRSGAEDAQPRG
jgi:hypothetical protein